MQKRAQDLVTQVETDQLQVSISPDGEFFPLPTEKDHIEEFDRLKKIVKEQRLKGREMRDLRA